MHYKKPKDRNELLLYPHMDLWIEEDNLVRLIDLVVERFTSENEGSITWGGHNDQGCTSYAPSTMLKLLVYCYLNWIPGSRRMENETYRNIELIWLLGDLKPDHWTICKFRRENGELIHSMAIEFRRFLKANGYIEGKTLSFDGSRMKANAGRDMYTERQLRSRIENIEQTLSRYFENMDEIDELEERLEREENDKDDLKKKIDKLEDEKNQLEEYKKRLEKSGKRFISPADPDANLMKCRDGKMACYNVQTAVDAKYHMLAMAEVSDDECDINLLKDDFEKVTEQLGVEPEEIEADRGYGNLSQIQEIQESSGTKCYVPIQGQWSKIQDKANGIEFKYDTDNDNFICSNNKRLYLLTRNFKQKDQTYNIYKCHDCEGCPVKVKCTTSKTGRAIKINLNHEWISNYQKWLEGEEAIEKIKQRKTLAEHPFGTIRMMMGKLCFLLRNKYKVQIETDLYATVYNIKRLINIDNIDKLMQKTSQYDWKIV